MYVIVKNRHLYFSANNTVRGGYEWFSLHHKPVVPGQWESKHGNLV